MGEISDALRRAGRDPAPKPPPREPAEVVPARRREDEEAGHAPERRRAAAPPPPERSDGPAAAKRAPATAGETASAAAHHRASNAAAATAQTAAPDPSPLPARRVEVLRTDGDPRFAAARITLADPQGPATQQYRRLAFRIREAADARGARSIVVTSARPLDGKTTTACNLAIQLARLDKALSVVLVDLDMRRAGVANSYGLTPEVPVDAVLRGDRRLDDAILDTDVPGLSLLALATPAPDAESLLALPSLERMIGELSRRFDFVVIDTPPVLATSDAQVILRHADAGLFVARTGTSPVKAVRRALDHIQTRKLLGSVLNASRTQHGLTEYPYYGYGRTDGTPDADAEAAATDAEDGAAAAGAYPDRAGEPAGDDAPAEDEHER